MKPEYFRCDSCGKIFPAHLMKKIRYAYNLYNGLAKKELSTEEINGMICVNCAQEEPVTTTTKKRYTKK